MQDELGIVTQRSGGPSTFNWNDLEDLVNDTDSTTNTGTVQKR